jgi:hypothetical protein
MNRKNMFRVLWSSRFSAMAAIAVLGLLFAAGGAQAGGGCAVPNKTGAAPAIPFVSPQGAGQPEGEESHGTSDIVGLWHLNYTAETETGAPIFPPVPFPFLESFKMWHADGTEFENAFMPPTGGNICFGVWKDLGHGTVKLHHIGLMFGADGSVSNIFTVDEKDTVSDDCKTYTGHFDFRLWPPSFDAVGVGTPIAEVTGKTLGTRITVD